MTRKLTTLFAATAILGGLGIGGIVMATTVFAEESSPPAQGMMSADQTKQMAQMVNNCNRMMESMNNAPAGSDKDRKTEHHG